MTPGAVPFGPDIGRLTTGLFTSLVPDVAERDIFLCSPPVLAKAVRTALLGADVPAWHLHEERFAF